MEDLIPSLYASLILDAFEGGDWPMARDHWEDAQQNMDTDQLVECWGFLEPYSLYRAYLKGDDRKAFEEERLWVKNDEPRS